MVPFIMCTSMDSASASAAAPATIAPTGWWHSPVDMDRQSPRREHCRALPAGSH